MEFVIAVVVVVVVGGYFGGAYMGWWNAPFVNPKD